MAATNEEHAGVQEKRVEEMQESLDQVNAELENMKHLNDNFGQNIAELEREKLKFQEDYNNLKLNFVSSIRAIIGNYFWQIIKIVLIAGSIGTKAKRAQRSIRRTVGKERSTRIGNHPTRICR